MSSRVLIEKEPNYTYVTARLLLDNLRTEALSFIYKKIFQQHQNR
jgi:ribonucleoside-diphosphate reductase alpha chain